MQIMITIQGNAQDAPALAFTVAQQFHQACDPHGRGERMKDHQLHDHEHQRPSSVFRPLRCTLRNS
jgi:hypothetical protein